MTSPADALVPSHQLAFQHTFKPQPVCDLAHRMVEGLTSGEFGLHYQPIVDAKTGHVRGAEALMRWEKPGSAVSPAVFIPVAEQSGVIHQLGLWALERACEQLKQFDAAGINLGYLAVNVSPVQLRAPGFKEDVLRTVRAAGVDASRIMLEITEGAMVAEPEKARALLLELGAAGLQFAADDFGTGFSSLAYLDQLPIHVLKVDRSFVANMVQSPQKQAIVRAVLRLARDLHLTTVAEGVETEDQAQLLRDQGCDCLQGWLFARAMPPEALRTALHGGALSLR